jgi:hypothetical protein
LAECLGMHDDLIKVVNGHNTIIALYYAMGGFHFGAVIIGDVAVNGLSCFSDLIIILGQKFVDFLDVPFDSLDIFFFPFSDIRIIVIVNGFRAFSLLFLQTQRGLQGPRRAISGPFERHWLARSQPINKHSRPISHCQFI